MQRRSLLIALNSIAVALFAGCQAKNRPSSNGSSERMEYQLATLSVLNADTSTHSIQLVVLRDDDIVYWGTVNVDSDSEWVANVDEFDTPTDREASATWEIFAKHANQTDGKVFNSADMVGTDGCIKPIITIHEGGEIGLTMDVAGGGCPGTGSEESNN